MGGISIWQLLIVAVIVILLFGTKKLRNLGGDLGSAVKGFKSASRRLGSLEKFSIFFKKNQAPSLLRALLLFFFFFSFGV